MERFGISIDENNVINNFDRAQAFTHTGDVVSDALGFQLHRGAFGVFSKSYDYELRTVLTQAGLTRQQIDETIAFYTEVSDGIALTPKTPLTIGEDTFDYVFFVNDRALAINAPGIMAEEIVHAEHRQMLKDRGIGKEEYDERFHELTIELLGYIGRRIVREQMGLQGGYEGRLRPDGGSKLHLAHFLGYQLLDELHDRNIPFSPQHLFHAPNEEALWETLRVTQDVFPIPITVPIPLNRAVDVDKVIKNSEETIQEAKAEQIIVPSFISEAA